MQPCPSDAALLQASADGLSSHLHECPTCASRLTELREEESLLQRVRRLAVSRTGRPAEDSNVRCDELPNIDGFRVLRLIAEGGMGRVYEAEQLHPRRRVALKLLRTGRESAPHRCRLFQREADALARLRHPDIAVVYSTGETHAGDPFLAMELLLGETLDAYAAHHAMLIDDILTLTARICRAVDHAHERGVIHRDLKPSNIMVDAHGNPKVLDFGLARIGAPDTGGMSSVTLDGRIAGTLAYMSPEQVCGRAGAVDARSDVYAIGVILFQLLTGTLPIETAGRGFAEIVDAIRSETPTAPSRLRAGVEPGVERIVLRALRKRPDDRYQSARELADDIDRCVAGLPIGAPAQGRGSRRAVGVALAMLAGAAALGMAARATGVLDPHGGEHARLTPVNATCSEEQESPSLPVHRYGPMVTLFGELGDLEAMLRARLANLRSAPAAGADVRGTEVRLALVLEDQGQFAEAERLFRDSLDDDHAPYRRLITMVRVARCVGAQGNHEEAGRLFAECMRGARRLGPQQAAVRTEIQVAVARDLMVRERFEDATLMLDQAYAALDDSAPNAQWSRWSVATALADCAHLTNEPGIEQAWRRRAAEVFARPTDVSVCQE